MLKEFLQNLSGPMSNIAYTYPSNNVIGGPTVTPKGIFSKILNVISNGASTSNFLGTYTNMQAPQNPAAAQAYLNSLNSYGVGSAVKTKEAFSPGSSINTLQVPPLPQTIPYSYPQLNQLNAAVNPLQGFAGQNGASAGAIPGGVTGGSFSPGGFGQPGQMIPGLNGFSPMGLGSGAFGKWSMFIMPLVGLLGLLRSLFSLKGTSGSMQPVQINKDALDYKVSLENTEKNLRTEGPLDDDYWGEDGESNAGNGFDLSKLEM